MRVPFLDLENLLKGYKNPVHSLVSQNHEDQNILPQRARAFENLSQNLEKIDQNSRKSPFKGPKNVKTFSDGLLNYFSRGEI